MVKADANLAIAAALVSEGVLNLGDTFVLCAGEVIGAHGDGDLTVACDIVVIEFNLRPAVAAVDSKALVLLVAVLDSSSVAANEVGVRIHYEGTEWCVCCLSGLEKHLTIAVAVELLGLGDRKSNVVFLVCVGSGDLDDGGGPRVLCFLDVFLGDGIDHLADVVLLIGGKAGTRDGV